MTPFQDSKPNFLNIKCKIAFILALTFLSCQINYDGDERLVVQGSLVNSTNQPISGQEIELWVYKNAGSAGSDTDLINLCTTDTNGQFLMVLPSPNNEDGFELKISDPNAVYQQKNLYNILEKNFRDYQYSTGSITLYQQNIITNAYITFNKTTVNTTLMEVKFEGDSDYMVWVNEPEIDYGDYTPTLPHDYFKNVPLNSSLTIIYTVRDNSTETLHTHETTFEITQEDLEHIITY